MANETWQAKVDDIGRIVTALQRRPAGSDVAPAPAEARP